MYNYQLHDTQFHSCSFSIFPSTVVIYKCFAAFSEGQCYSCMDHGANELKHPSRGGYEKGHKGYGSHCGYADGSERGIQHIHKGYGSHCGYDDGSDDDECGMWHIRYISYFLFSCC